MNQITLSNRGSISGPRKIFIEEVLKIAEKRGSALDFDEESGAWSDGFGLSFGKKIDFDEGLFQMCRCYILTKNLDVKVPESNS